MCIYVYVLRLLTCFILLAGLVLEASPFLHLDPVRRRRFYAFVLMWLSPSCSALLLVPACAMSTREACHGAAVPLVFNDTFP